MRREIPAAAGLVAGAALERLGHALLLELGDGGGDLGQHVRRCWATRAVRGRAAALSVR